MLNGHDPALRADHPVRFGFLMRKAVCGQIHGPIGDRVQVRTVNVGKNFQVPTYESNASWYDVSRHDATFVIAGSRLAYRAAVFERHFGKPAAAYRVAGWLVLIYRTNLLKQVEPLGGWPALTRPGAAPAQAGAANLVRR